MNKNLLLTLMIASLLGCEGDPETTLQNNINTTPPEIAIFSPSDSAVPFPSNILLGTDGTLNIPVIDASDVSDPKVSMNALDGFSTIAPITTTFSSAIDAATIPGNVRVFELVTNGAFVATALTRELTMLNGTIGEFVVTVSGQTTLVISPLVPLKEKTTYAVVIKSGLRNTSGVAFTSDTAYALSKQSTSLLNGSASAVPALTYAQALALEPWRVITSAAEERIVANASNPAIASNEIILSWTFTTQSIGDVLAYERIDIVADNAPSVGTFSSFGNAAGVSSTVYQSTINVSYYLQIPSNVNDPTPLTSHWVGASDSTLSRYNVNAVSRSTQTIPLLVAVPTLIKPVSGYPVVIFQHGITQDRTNMLAVANTLATAGFAVVAIDLPLHGVTNSSNPFYTSNERTFNLDLVTQNSSGAITNPAPDPTPVTDSSGRHFIQLASLLTSRDNVRQGVTDLFTLTKAIATMDVDTGGADFDATQIYFLGHSLGAIVGTTFLALEPNVKDAVLAMPAGGIAKVLDGSASFGPEIAAGLATNGVAKGTADYESFMIAAQTVLDTTDPVNFANGTMGQTDGGAGAITGRGLLMFEVVGDGVSPSDLVIPNAVPDSNDTTGTVASPLAGTTPLARLMGLTQVTADTSGTDLKGIVRFSAGHHGSLLTTSNTTSVLAVRESAATFTEMQSIMATFLEFAGNTINITDTNVIAP